MLRSVKLRSASRLGRKLQTAAQNGERDSLVTSTPAPPPPPPKPDPSITPPHYGIPPHLRADKDADDLIRDYALARDKVRSQTHPSFHEQADFLRKREDLKRAILGGGTWR